MPLLCPVESKISISSSHNSFARPYLSPPTGSPSNCTLPVTHCAIHQSADDGPYVAYSSSGPPCPQDSSAAVAYPSSSLSTPLQTHLGRRGTTRNSIGKQPPGKSDRGHIKRPENAFILFRKQKCKEHQNAQESTSPTKKWRQADLSKQISQQWKTLPFKEKWYWKALAEAKKAWHEAMYPDYIYSPRPRKKKTKTNSHSKSEDAQTQVFCFLPASLSLDDTTNHGLTHVSNPNCDAFRSQPPPTSPADDPFTIPTLLSPAENTGTLAEATTTGDRQPEPEVAIQYPCHDLFFTQTFDISALEDATHSVSLDIPLRQ